jgi:hypothetical protein
MNKIYLFSVFSFLGILMCFSPFILQAQNEKQLTLIVKIIPEVLEKGGCVVEVIKNGKETSKIDIPVSKKYTLALDFFNTYSLIFKYPGHLDKTISVSTEIPKEIWQKNPKYPQFPMLVTLVKKTTENARDELCKPSLGIAYDKEIDNFVKVDLKK